MHKQVDLDRLLTEAGGGIKVKPSELTQTIEKLLCDSKLHLEMSEKGKYAAQKTLGVSFRTWNLINSNISLEKKS